MLTDNLILILMKQKIGHKLTAIAVILPILLLLSCTKKQNWPQFRGPDSNIVVASGNRATGFWRQASGNSPSEGVRGGFIIS
jgi:hypothetical protein